MIKKLKYVFLLLCLSALLILTACSGNVNSVNNDNAVKTDNTASPIAAPPAPGGCCQ